MRRLPPRFARPIGTHLVLWAILAAGCVGLAGCGGCRMSADDDDEKEPAAEKQPQRKPDYEILPVATQGSRPPSGEYSIKPGHWTAGTVEATANHRDFIGDAWLQLVDDDGKPLPLSPQPTDLRFSRRMVLPKEQPRQAELPMFAPASARDVRAGAWLSQPSGRTALITRYQPLRVMPAHQYLMVVLAGTPESYRFLTSLDSITAPGGIDGVAGSDAHYRVLMPTARQRVPLPHGALLWSTVAVIWWDDFDPALLSTEQQHALIDWLHWGGELIISGPGSLSPLRGSFLDPWLPADGETSWELTPEDLTAFDVWAVGQRRLETARSFSGQRLRPRFEAQRPPLLAAGDEPLLVERRVGRGRIVVSAFHLHERELVRWPSYDGLVNALLLRRPARRFTLEQNVALKVSWLQGDRLDPRYITRLRYFSRDTGRTFQPDDRQGALPPNLTGFYPQERETFELGPPIGPGVAAWRDDNRVSDAARRALRDAAGIVVPSANLVVSVVAGYLLVLVPLNCLVFWLLGRVEWAWATTPLIAVGFAVLVVRQAELDIGFSRARTEIAVVEAYNGYPRAHLTRYTALYNSVGTNYQVGYSDRSALALPFDAGHAHLQHPSRGTVLLRTAADSAAEGSAVKLENVQVGSNSTGMVHSEEMFDLGGAIKATLLDDGRVRVNNQTKYAWEGAFVASTHGCGWVGRLTPGATVEVALATNTSDALIQRMLAEVRERDAQQGGDSVTRHLLQLASEAADSTAGDALLLVGVGRDELPGVDLRPRVVQTRCASLLVAHLRAAADPPPQLDANARADFAALQVHSAPADAENQNQPD